MVGTILSVSSGLCVGPEGPLVHIGAVVGSSVTKTGKIELWIRKFRRKHPIMSGLFGCASDTSELLNVLEKESNERLDNDGSGPRMTASRWWHKLAWRNR